MTTTAKTIQIFLPGGDPRGIRVAEITTRIVQVIEVPRSLLFDFLKMPESEQVAVYFLIGDAGDGGSPQVYLGQTGDVRTRLARHNKEKDFWQRALVLISRTNTLTQTHGLFLEWYCLQAVKKAGRYVDENGNSGSRPHTPAPMEADCLEIFETGRTLLSTLGHPVFDPVAAPLASMEPAEVFYLKGPDTDARGLYTPEGFVVLKGSYGRRTNVPSIEGNNEGHFRTKLIDAAVLRPDGDRVVLDKDHLFNSPSIAGLAMLGRTSNGWRDWKSKDGKTLDALKRGAPAGKP